MRYWPSIDESMIARGAEGRKEGRAPRYASRTFVAMQTPRRRRPRPVRSGRSALEETEEKHLEQLRKISIFQNRLKK